MQHFCNCTSFCRCMLSLLLWCTVALALSCDKKQQGASSQQKFAVKDTSEGVEVMTPDGSLRIAGNEKDAHIKIKSDQSGTIEMHYKSESLVPGFPQEVPIYSPATVKMSQCFQGGNAVATLSTTDNMSKVAQFYREQLPEKGFTLGEEVSLRDLLLLQGNKDSQKLNISLKRSQTETIINLALTDQSQKSVP